MKIDTSHWIDQTEISRYLPDVRKYSTLTKDEERELLVKIYNGCKISRDILIKSNLRFVISVAKKYQNKGLSFSDLISEGNYGLVKAIDRFNYKENDVRFLSYAVWWIQQSITQALNEVSRTIRLPANLINDIHKEYKKPLIDEICGNDLIPQIKIDTLDSEFDSDGRTLYDMIENVDVKKPDNQMDNERINLLNALKKIVNKLTDVERIIISEYFGLEGEERTLQDIANDLGLTKERVRQIKEKSIRKLRNHSVEFFDLL